MAHKKRSVFDKDKTFSSKDIIRITLFYLSDSEQVEVFNFFNSEAVQDYFFKKQNYLAWLLERYIKFFWALDSLIGAVQRLDVISMYLSIKYLITQRRDLVEDTWEWLVASEQVTQRLRNLQTKYELLLEQSQN